MVLRKKKSALFRNRRKNIARHFVDKRLWFRMRIFFAIIMLFGATILYDLLTGTVSVLLAMAGVVLGVGIGFIAGRMFSIRWHPTNNKVVAQIDAFGVIILLAYLAFSLFRTQIIGQIIQGPELPTIVFCVLAGTILGRFISTGISIRHVLHTQGITKKK